MVGGVATLRHEKLTVEELHRSIPGLRDEPAGERLLWEDRKSRRNCRRKPMPSLVGMAYVFPGHPIWNPTGKVFWKGGLRTRSSSRWKAETYFDPNGVPGESTPSKWEALLSPEFDPLLCGSPRITAIEPVQLLSLEVARRALKHAGYESRAFNRGEPPSSSEPKQDRPDRRLWFQGALSAVYGRTSGRT